MDQTKYLEELDLLEKQIEEEKFVLSDEEQKLMSEILELQSSIKDKNVLKDLGGAALKGVEDYINSFIDTSEIIDDLKTPTSLHFNSREIGSLTPSADPCAPRPTRSMWEAQTSPYPAYAESSKQGLSDSAKDRISSYEAAYRDRTKTIFAHPHTNKDSSVNFVTLAGLESYRFGPKVPLYSAEEYKEMYQAEGCPANLNYTIREKWNFKKFDNEAYKSFGFGSAKEFKDWREANKLTIHESPDGMFLVPADVHNAERHMGEKSKIESYLKGEISKEELDKFEAKERMTYLANEGVVRVGRVATGAAMSTIKVFAQKTSSIIVSETYKEFKLDSNEDFGQRVKHICTNSIERFKRELQDIIAQIKQAMKGNALTEVMNLINDLIINYVGKTIKNIFKVIRQMMSSIFRALKVLCSKDHPWEEKIFEASKILSAGAVAVLGYSLNTVLEELFMKIPIINGAASILADMFAGLFACILSSLVLYLFDSYKDRLAVKDTMMQIQMRNNELVGYRLQLSGLDTLSTSVSVTKMAAVVASQMESMAQLGNESDQYIAESKDLIRDTESKIAMLKARRNQTQQ